MLRRKFKTKLSSTLLILVLVLTMVLGNIPVSDYTDAGGQIVLAAEENANLFQATERTTDFNENWQFELEAAGEPQEESYDDSSWETLTLPYDWSIEQDFSTQIPTSVGALKGGTGWFRKHFILSENDLGKRINIDFDGVYQDCYLWVNGELVGNYPNGYIPFSFDITDYVVCDGKTENVIAVKVTNVTDSENKTSRWYSGSGIYRDVHITMTEPIHLAQYGTVIKTPNIKNEYESGKITTEITTSVENESSEDVDVSVRSTILEYKSGEVFHGAQPVVSEPLRVEVGESTDFSQEILVEQPKLWSVENPNLYKMRTEILVDGKVVDTYDTRFGFNWSEFDSDKGFSLNGESMKLQGVCMHHDQGALGAVASVAAFKRQMKIMQEMGVNAIRTAHNAAAPELMRICDELGIMVFEESFDSWWDGKNEKDYGKQFFSQECTYPGVEEGTTWAKFDLQQIIKKDRNCPSIILWGIGNECAETNSQKAINFTDEIMSWVKEVDTEHGATMGENKYKVDWGVPENLKKVDDKLDVVGLNYGEIYYDSLHEEYPDWTIFGSETSSALSSRGYYSSPWINGNHVVDNVAGNQAQDVVAGKQLSSYDNRSARFGRSATQALIFDRDREFVSGQFVWTGFDYIGEPEPFYGGSKSSYFGIVDTAGFPKDNYYLYQSQWLSVEEEPMVHLLPHWNWEKDSLRKQVTYPEKTELSKLDPGEINEYSDDDIGKIPMRVYSNAPEVELFVDGVSQGKKKFAQKITNYGRKYQQQSEDSDRLYLEWPLMWNYKIGTKIEAVAYDEDGKEIARDQVVTAGEATKLEATADRTEIEADGLDLSYITVDVQDEDGNFAPNADNKIYFDIEGDGEIVGVDNGDATSRERYKDTGGVWKRSAFNGKTLVIVRSTKEEGSFTVTAQGEGLEDASVTVTTKYNLESTTENPVPSPSVSPSISPSVNSPSQVQQSVEDKNIVQEQKKIQNGQKFLKGSLQYKVLNKNKKTVTVTSVTSKSLKKITIPATITLNGTVFKVTKIADSVFKNCKKLKEVKIGKNVKIIGRLSFYNCGKLNRIYMKGTGIAKIQAKAFSKIRKKAIIYVPKKKFALYKQLLKKSGLKSGYKIKMK